MLNMVRNSFSRALLEGKCSFAHTLWDLCQDSSYIIELHHLLHALTW